MLCLKIIQKTIDKAFNVAIYCGVKLLNVSVRRLE
jgi:hypothetical protein